MKNIKKVIRFNELNSIRKKNKNLKITLVHGTFDFFHYGHFLHLKKSSSYGDILIVSLTADKFVQKGPGRPFYNEKIRLNYIKNFDFVNYILIANYPTAIEVINALKPNIYVKGSDYVDFKKDHTKQIVNEVKMLKKNNGKFITTNEKTFSASHLLNIFNDKFTEETKNFLIKFKKNHNFDSIYKKLNKLSSKKILLIGESIFDEYIFVKTLAKSPKEEIISVQELDRKKYLGGILATASQICDFPKQIEVLTLLGNDKKLIDFTNQTLNKKIKIHNIKDNNRKSIIKTRYLEFNKKQKLFQNNTLDINFINKNTEDKILNFLNKKKNKFDAVLVNDFGHGFLTNRIRDYLCKNFSNLSVNVQTNSANLGYNLITNYKKCDYFTIDEPEARLATRNRFGNISEIFKKLQKQIYFKSASITFGDKGAHIFKNKKIFHLPALSKNVIDTLGAGDAYFAYSSLFKIVSNDEHEYAFLGNLAGAIKIQYLGHEKYIEKNVFTQFLKSVLS